MTAIRGHRAKAWTPRKRMVGWFDPRLLAMTGFRAGTASVFGTYLDKRELEDRENLQRVEGCAKVDETWIDFVADCGDAFDPTFAIAWHLSREELEVTHRNGDTETLPRGSHLVMGGDQVYPTPSRSRYHNQLIGPYAAAFPSLPDGEPAPKLLALPGNHDWYDGLTLFLEQFGLGNNIGAWETPQRRSYFAIPLPHNWWLWAVDSGLGGHIDEPQRKYFADLELEDDAKIILCWSTPAWNQTITKPEEIRLLIAFVNENVTPRGATVPLYLSGDHHHYARYKTDTSQLVTAGGGGAFLSPTHHLDARPKRFDRDDTVELPSRHCQCLWPEKGTSERFLRRLALFPLYNPSFLLFTGVINLFLAWGVMTGNGADSEIWSGGVRGIAYATAFRGMGQAPVATLLALMMLAGFAAFARQSLRYPRAPVWFVGALHGVAQIAISLLAIMLAADWSDALFGGDVSFNLGFLLGAAVLGGVLSGVLVGFYLWLTNVSLWMHDNEAFSALHSRRFKHFVRMQINADGLRVYAIGLDEVGRGWDHETAATSSTPACRNSDVVRPIVVDSFLIPNEADGPRPRRPRRRAPA